MSGPALFLDRDGIVNLDHGYVHRVEDFAFVDGILDLCRRFHVAGFKLVIVTNQSGIARGYYSEDQYQALSAWMRERFEQVGAPLAGVYHCPHHPGVPGPLGIACGCRKPAPGLILRAVAELDLDLAASALVGDKARDIESARRAGIGTAWLVSRDPGEIAAAGADRVFVSVRELAEAVAVGMPSALREGSAQ